MINVFSIAFAMASWIGFVLMITSLVPFIDMEHIVLIISIGAAPATAGYFLGASAYDLISHFMKAWRK